MAHETFGSRLKSAREARGLSQRELSEAAGLHKSHIPVLEADERPNVAVPTVERLAAALSVSIDWLVLGVGRGPTKKTGTDG